MSRRIVIQALILLAIGIAVAFAIPASRIRIIGKIRGEPFYDGKPCSYWIGVIQESDDEKARLRATTALGLMARERKDALEALVGALRDPSVEVREYTVRELEYAGPRAKNCIPALIEVLRDKREKLSVRELVPEALGRVGVDNREAVIPALEQTARDEFGSLRWSAWHVLIYLRGEDALYLQGLLVSADPEVRGLAIAALSNLGSNTSAVPSVVAALLGLHQLDPDGRTVILILIRFLDHRSAPVRGAAAESLGNFGQRAHMAIPTLRVLLTDRDESVRSSARRAIEQISREVERLDVWDKELSA